MAETRQHVRRLPEIEARDEEYMRMRRAGYASVQAASRLGMTDNVRQRVESEFNAQYGHPQTRPANDDSAYVAAVEKAGGFGRFLETRGKDGQPRLTGPYVPYAVERRAMGARG